MGSRAWLCIYLFYRLIGLLFYFIDSLVHWFIDSLVYSIHLIDSLVHRLIDSLGYYSILSSHWLIAHFNRPERDDKPGVDFFFLKKKNLIGLFSGEHKKTL